MTAPWTHTRIEVEPGHIGIAVDLIGGDAVDEDRASQLRARLADAVEGVIENFYGDAGNDD